MPDDFAHTTAMDGAPRSWGEAFASLPMETPDGDGWRRLSNRLDAPVARQRAMRRERRTNWLIGVASAAVLVLAAWSPLSQWLRGDEARPAVVAAVPDVPGVQGPAAPLRTGPRVAAPAIIAAVPDRTTASEAPRSQTQVAATHRNTARKHRPQGELARIEQTPATQPVAAGTSTPTAPESANTAQTDPLQQLKAQSAQLEALVALARDERVGNASNALLSGELDAGIAVVDAALSQSDLSPSRRQELWQQRVDLLQQLAGVEATSRWLAAQGASNETLLVSVD